MARLLLIVSCLIACLTPAARSSQDAEGRYPGLLRVNLAPGEPSWRTDPAWNRGPAEWALYEASRTIYGRARAYEAVIFTNKQHMDPATTAKAADWRADGAIEVFKHNVSEVIPTENYDYRFLSTSFIRTADLEPYKVVISTQEDCGATYKQFTFSGGNGGTVDATSFCYFPDAGESRATFRLPGLSTHFRFHDDLTLTLRDFPFENPDRSDHMMKLIADQTDTHETPTEFKEARVDLIGRETLSVPYGEIDTYHLRVSHDEMGGVRESHYWFAVDADRMRHVLVRYRGPWGVEYKLKDLAWWAYWDRASKKDRIRPGS